MLKAGSVYTALLAPEKAKEYTYMLGETRLNISADVHARVFTSALIYYFRMQRQETVLMFPLFSTLLALIKKRAPP
jgi:hypothetical protein